MVKYVMMLTNVTMDYITATLMRLARTLWVPIHVHATMVFMEMVVYALTITSAAMEVIHAVIMPAVLTIKGHTAASVKEGMLETDDNAMVST